MAVKKITVVDEIETTENQWWFLYEKSTKELRDLPIQLSGYISSSRILVLGDTEEEVLTYIKDKGLIIPEELVEE
tara:strand:+ start:1638 stop:1862 length:225 start_codon:yes stop_codon:yes gene_type:complete